MPRKRERIERQIRDFFGISRQWTGTIFNERLISNQLALRVEDRLSF